MHTLFCAILNIFPCLEISLGPGTYLIKLASAFPVSHRSPNLSIFANTSFRFDVLSIDETAETSFSGFNLSPN